MAITVYTFEDAEGPFGEFITQDYQQAKNYARHNKLAVVANEYEWSDSELVNDYR